MRLIYKLVIPLLFARRTEAKIANIDSEDFMDNKNEKFFFQHILTLYIFFLSIIPIAYTNKIYNFDISSMNIVLIVLIFSLTLSVFIIYILSNCHFFVKSIRIHNLFINNKESIYLKRWFSILLILSYSAFPVIAMYLIFHIYRFFGY